jgi:hypothetical protein
VYRGEEDEARVGGDCDKLNVMIVYDVVVVDSYVTFRPCTTKARRDRGKVRDKSLWPWELSALERLRIGP